MKTMKQAFDEAADDEGVYTLYLTGEEARATLRALAAVCDDDPDAATAHGRLARRLESRRSPASTGDARRG